MIEQFQQLISGLPAWAQEPAALIGAAVALGLLLLWLLSLITRRKPREDLDPAETYPAAEELPVIRPITPPPVTPPMEAPLAPPPVYAAPDPEPAPEPVAFAAPEPEPVAGTSEPAPLADEPIAAAAPFDASPASIAADVPESEPVAEPEPEPVFAPASEPEPAAAAPESAAPAPAAPDDLTRMKGVGPRLADRLASVGFTNFAQLAALTPEGADALDAKLGDFQGRIHRDRWIEQAGYLANGDVAGFEETFGKL